MLAAAMEHYTCSNLMNVKPTALLAECFVTGFLEIKCKPGVTLQFMGLHTFCCKYIQGREAQIWKEYFTLYGLTTVRN